MATELLAGGGDAVGRLVTALLSASHGVAAVCLALVPASALLAAASHEATRSGSVAGIRFVIF